MNLAELSQERRFQEDNGTNESDSEDRKDKNTRMKDIVRNQRATSDVSPLNLLKEDFSQVRGVLKAFMDKDTKTDCEDDTLSRAAIKPAVSTLDLLKDDFSQFKEDITSVFGISSAKDQETKSTEKTINRMSFNLFKDELSSVFKIHVPKERNTTNEDALNTLKMKDAKAENTDEPFKSLFRRVQRTSQNAQNSRIVRKAFVESSAEQLDDIFRGNLLEQQEETVDAEKIISSTKKWRSELEDSELDITVCVEGTTMVSESEERMPTSPTAEKRCESKAWSDDTVASEEEKMNEDEDKPSEISLWESLSSGISLFNLRGPNKDSMRDQPGDEMWSVKNYACYLTLDPNTANSELRLTDCNRKVTRDWPHQQLLDHPDRFEHCPQVLCREGLLDSAYWEVVWSGGADIGIASNSLPRDGDVSSCLLGHNKLSWSLECSEGIYTPCHANKRFTSSSPRPFTHRVGVYLDWPAGSLSFYSVSQNAMVHLHTFTATFSEPLYPAFWVWTYDGSVSLSQVELEWEQLL